MPQTITTGYKSLLEAAEREIESLSVEEAIALHGRDDVVFVDIRDPRELQRDGKMPGAFSLHARHAGILDRSGKPVSQADFRSRTRNSCSSAPADCARRSPRRPRSAWG